MVRGTASKKGQKRRYRILVVDDEPSIRQLLFDFFTVRGYSVEHAADGVEALSRIEKKPPDIIISDIRMPIMDGIELFAIIKSHYPQIKHILMTGYNVDEYLSLIRRHNIGNILIKGPDFNLREVGEYVHSILTGDIFGLDRYFPASKLHSVAIDCYARSAEVCALISKQCPDETGFYLSMAIDELIANAVFHGVLRMTGVSREKWQDDIVVDPESAIKVTWASDKEKIGVAVEDTKGNLTKVDALKWIDQEDSSGRENEEHGRGLFLVRRLIDRFIINIDHGKRTECIVIQNDKRDHLSSYKPLLIHEI
jgi:CheY-like chemotaxis protein/anti-sigma regulatory factor (Ser/Thr protein kinase)